MNEAEDYHNFSSPSNHRLPTLTGTQALRNAVEKSKPIPTTLPALDDLLSSASNSSTDHGGIQLGSVTELYGPPAAGKTTFALQLAVNTICDGHDEGCVTWIDTSFRLVRSRLVQLMEGRLAFVNQEMPPTQTEVSCESLLEKRFNYLSITRLPHLLSLLLHPPTTFPKPGTRLVVIEDLSNLLQASLPQVILPQKGHSSNSARQIRDEAAAKLAATRRSNIIASLASGLQKLASAKNVAIVVTSQTSSSLKDSRKAMLVPAINLQAWKISTSTRIALYRDDWPAIDLTALDRDEAKRQVRRRRFHLRVVEVERLNHRDVTCDTIHFVILKTGLRGVDEHQTLKPQSVLIATPAQQLTEAGDDNDVHEFAGSEAVENDGLQMSENPPSSFAEPIQQVASTKSVKRKALEIADSEDEDEVEENGDPALPSLPPMPLRGFLPSSQLHEDVEEVDTAVARNALPKNDDPSVSSVLLTDAPQETGDMLLDEFEDKLYS